MFNKLNLYSTLMDRLEQFSTKLLLVKRLPVTYRACLIEVIRRNDFTQQYTSQANTMAEQMAAAREAEVWNRRFEVVPFGAVSMPRAPSSTRWDGPAHAAATPHACAHTQRAPSSAQVTLRDNFMREFGAFLPGGLPVLLSLLQARPIYFEVSTVRGGDAPDNALCQLSQALAI